MRFKLTLFAFALILATTLLLTGCNQNEVYMCPSGVMAGGQQMTGDDVFICPDGSKTTSVEGCSYPLQRTVDNRAAEDNAMQYIQGYVSANGWSPRIVNVNFDNGSYYAQVIVSKYDENPFETTLKIHGVTGSVTCEDGCFYLQ
ncbi:MAG: hypothetical protein ACQESE_05300 [Nanobdellota archaeon]